MRPLSLDQIEAARIKILQNAVELVSEATVLFENERYARCFTLSRIALEELHRLPMIVRAGLDLSTGRDVDWKKLARRMTSHKTKIDMSHLMTYILADTHADDRDLKALLENYDSTPELNQLKNHSLYADIIDDDFLKPSDIIDADLADAALALARDRASYFEAVEEKTRGRIRDFADGYDKLIRAYEASSFKRDDA